MIDFHAAYIILFLAVRPYGQTDLVQRYFLKPQESSSFGHWLVPPQAAILSQKQVADRMLPVESQAV